MHHETEPSHGTSALNARSQSGAPTEIDALPRNRQDKLAGLQNEGTTSIEDSVDEVSAGRNLVVLQSEVEGREEPRNRKPASIPDAEATSKEQVNRGGGVLVILRRGIDLEVARR
jgi:hypothetical protein